MPMEASLLVNESNKNGMASSAFAMLAPGILVAGRLGDSVRSLVATLIFFAYVAAREVVRIFGG